MRFHVAALLLWLPWPLLTNDVERWACVVAAIGCLVSGTISAIRKIHAP